MRCARHSRPIHLRRYGFVSPEKRVFAATLEVEAQGGGASAFEPDLPITGDGAPTARTSTRFFSGNAWHDAPVYFRDALLPGHKITGPALVIEPHQTVSVEPGWNLEVTRKNHLVMRRVVARAKERLAAKADPMLLEVFNNLFMSIAEQMGEALRNTAQSVNIKERLDFSCAVFDATGALVANAPHMPVHLGSMDRSVETIIAMNRGRMQPGDVYMLNAPYNGGTHLPDITVITPVFAPASSEILFYVASRGHHEDIGGLTPGSMTPKATHIDEEGVYIDNFKLVDRGRFLEAETHALLSGAKYPARRPDKNIADLKAHVAANAKGMTELDKMVRHFGLDVVKAYMGHVQDNAEESVRRLLSRLKDGHFRVEMDQGTHVEVTITVDQQNRSAVVDFTGTSPSPGNNFNAPAPVTRAATLYVFRIMCEEPIPMNAGCMKPITLEIPQGSLLAPVYPAAVVAGNVETSQIVTNCLLGALRRDGAEPGHHEQSHLRQRPGAVLRDDLLGLAGRLLPQWPRLQRHLRRARAHDQHAAHRPGDTGAALPGAARDLRHPPRLRRQGQVVRWRRHLPPDPFPRAHGLRDPVRLPQGAPLRPRWRRTRPVRPQRGAPADRRRGGIAGLRPDRARGRRGDHHRDADRRRRRQGVNRPFNSA